MGSMNLIKGLEIHNLKIIPNPNGEIKHIIKSNDKGFVGFGEVYTSSVNYNCIKAWKRHHQMTSNLVCIQGVIKIVILDLRQNYTNLANYNEFILSPTNYKRITIPPGLWYGFQGIGENTNILVNIYDIIHDPSEQESIDINSFVNFYKW